MINPRSGMLLSHRAAYRTTNKLESGDETNVRNFKQTFKMDSGNEIFIIDELQSKYLSINDKNSVLTLEKKIEGYRKTLEITRKDTNLDEVPFIVLAENIISEFEGILKFKNMTSSELYTNLLSEIQNTEQRLHELKHTLSQGSDLTVSCATSICKDLSWTINPPSSPSIGKGILSGAVTVGVNIIGNIVAKMLQARDEVKLKLAKVRLLGLYNECLKKGCTIHPDLDKRLDKILDVRRNKCDFLFPTRSSLMKEKIKKARTLKNTEVQQPKVISKIIEFENKLFKFSKGHDQHGLAEALNNLMTEVGPNSETMVPELEPKNICDYIWRLLNQSKYYDTSFSDNGLRRKYLTPIEVLLRDDRASSELKHIITGMDDSRMAINKNECVYSKYYIRLYNILQKSTKDNIIENLHKVRLIIQYSDKLDSSQKFHLYDELMECQLTPGHGRLFLVANTRIELSLFTRSIHNLLFSGSKSSFANSALPHTLTNNITSLELSNNLGLLSKTGIYRNYLDRSHTLNTVNDINGSNYEYFKQCCGRSSQYFTIQTHELSEHHKYIRSISLINQDGKVLPRIMFEIKGTKDIKDCLTSFYTNAMKYDDRLKNILPWNSNQKSHLEFENFANKVFKNMADDPLIAICWLCGIALSDDRDEKRLEKLYLIINILRQSSNDSRSILFDKFHTNSFVSDIVSFVLTSICSVVSGVAFTLLPPSILPVISVIGWLQSGITDSNTVKWLIRNLYVSDTEEAAIDMLEDTKSVFTSEKVKELAKHLAALYSQLESREVSLYSPINESINGCSENVIKILSKETSKIAKIDFNSSKSFEEVLHFQDSCTQEQTLIKLLILSHMIHDADRNTLSTMRKIELLSELINKVQSGEVMRNIRSPNTPLYEAWINPKAAISSLCLLGIASSSSFIPNPVKSKVTVLFIDLVKNISLGLGLEINKEEYTRSYSKIIKLLKEQLLYYVKNGSELDLEQIKSDQAVIAALGVRRSRIAFGRTDSQIILEGLSTRSSIDRV